MSIQIRWVKPKRGNSKTKWNRLIVSPIAAWQWEKRNMQRWQMAIYGNRPLAELDWSAPCKNVSSGICGQRRPRSACAFAQSDQGLHIPLTESLNTITCTKVEQMPGWDFAHAQDESESVHFAHVRRQLFAGAAHIALRYKCVETFLFLFLFCLFVYLFVCFVFVCFVFVCFVVFF